MRMVQGRAQKNRRRSAPPERLSRDDWAMAALFEIGRVGALTPSVEKLAADLGVTKGSFKSRDELVQAALELWERVATDAVIAELACIEAPLGRLRGLLDQIFREPKHLMVEGVILACADDAKFGRFIRRVSRRRLRYVQAAYEESGLSKCLAEHWGLLAYSAFVGALHVMRTAPMMREADELERYASFLHRALVDAHRL
jgi:Arc/MetJ-type ribon-helix-helix transcriptional regulator